MKGIVYKITNKENGKAYIGQTRKSLNRRFVEHKLSSTKTAIHNAIVKYGTNSFTLEVLKKCEINKLDYFETKFIKTHSTLYPNGYNLKTGGHTGFKYTDEVKEKISKSKIGKKPNRDYKVSYSQRLDISRTLGGKPILVTNLKTGVQFTLLTSHAGKDFGFQPWNIIAVCKGKRNTHKNHTFKYYLENKHANTEETRWVTPTSSVERSVETANAEYNTPRVSNTFTGENVRRPYRKL